MQIKFNSIYILNHGQINFNVKIWGLITGTVINGYAAVNNS